jgi:RimJ/RimL family protein N-acetyltransferase
VKPKTANRAPAIGQQALICKVGLSDIAPIFNLIQECSLLGCFSKLYLQPRYQAGLALQLFGVWLMRKLRLPGGDWHKADLQVLRCQDKFAGFMLIRYQMPSGADREIYMCAIEKQYRGRGLGKLLIQELFDGMAAGQCIEADCLPNAIAMKHLLANLGFQNVTPGQKSVSMVTAKKFRYCR